MNLESESALQARRCCCYSGCYCYYYSYSSNRGSYGGLEAKLCLTLATPETVARQAPLSMGFSRQEH